MLKANKTTPETETIEIGDQLQCLAVATARKAVSTVATGRSNSNRRSNTPLQGEEEEQPDTAAPKDANTKIKSV